MYHNNIMNFVQFKIDDINIIYAIPSKLQKILEITDYEDGFITMQTNYGEEYTDLIDLVDNSIFTDNYKDKAKRLLSKLKKNDIILKGDNND